MSTPTPGKSTFSGKIPDPTQITKATANVLTPASLLIILVMGQGYLSEQEESDTKVRIHVELMDNKINGLEEKLEEAEIEAKATAKRHAKQVDELGEEIQELKQCVIAPKKCK